MSDYEDVRRAEAALIAAATTAGFRYSGTCDIAEEISAIGSDSEIAAVAPQLAAYARAQAGLPEVVVTRADVAAMNAATRANDVPVNDKSSWGGGKLGPGGPTKNQYSGLVRRTR